MADISVKLFGVFRSDTHISHTNINADRVVDIFPAINSAAQAAFEEKKKESPELQKPEPIKFKDAIVYIDGEKCSKKNRELKDGAEIWIMSPASGG